MTAMALPILRADAPPLLIAAISARALAESARRGGYRATVLDCFADRDTRAAAAECRAVSRAGSLHFDRRALLDAAAELAPAAPLVYGAGFEARPGLLSRLVHGRELIGNPPAVVRAVKDPRRFFPLLDVLAIPHPRVREAAPPVPEGWLIKHGGGAGGTHIQPAGSRRPRRGDYFQQRETGRAMSALFLADGRRALILGFNEQWTSAAREGLSYLYGGAVGRVPIAAPLDAWIRDRLDALVAETGLRGLNGLDFLLDGERWSVLELNPRPPATMDLYDPDYEDGLVRLHVEACHGNLPVTARAGPARAQRIVHSREGWRVDSRFAFPGWCRDIPGPGTDIRPGDPVCTVHAEAADAAEATRQVLERQHELQRMIRG
jgi:predicted ATP-grasp superfamily ATP-dependent carboligase